MSRLAGAALLAGRVQLSGLAPNGQRLAEPSTMGCKPQRRHDRRDEPLEMGAAPQQAQLGDFPIPQRGMFVIGRAFFTDATRPAEAAV